MNGLPQNFYPYIITYGSEIRVIAGLAHQFGNLETGGDLWGSYSRAGRPQIDQITGPGPEAIHEPAHFMQDRNFFLSLHDMLTNHYNCQWLGTWHSHGVLRLDQPSNGDLAQVASVTRRNGLQCWCEIIVTQELAPCKGFFKKSRRLVPGKLNTGIVTLNAFDYADPQQGRCQRVPLHLLPGFSPLRLALLASGKLDPLALGEHGLSFPLSQIRYDKNTDLNDIDSESASRSPALNHLSRQCQQLPESIQQKIEFSVEENDVQVSFVLPTDHIVHCHYDHALPLVLKHITLQDPQGRLQREFHPEMLKQGAQSSLKHIYQYMLLLHQPVCEQQTKEDKHLES